MKEAKSDNFSWTSYLIDLRFDDTHLAFGTSFMITRDANSYLITNWHNVTGQNPETMEFLTGTICFPNNLNVYLVDKNRYSVGEQTTISWSTLNIKLLDDEDSKLWIEHPLYKQGIDVVAIPIIVPDNLVAFSIDQFIEPHNEDTEIHIGQDIYVLGFPFNNTGGGFFPIWKRASIASEPAIDIGGVPKMFVDTASRSGMSGSPVILKERRTVSIHKDGKVSNNYTKLVGIYSGRIGASDELQAQLGIVWKASVIDEIINQ
ncbi:trypsin-like peptidase domain-containing protein [Pedobacter sp. KBS0701]|uniref:trypsin-like peptidase domain-containing protein n=1 Tax=Pedobacter sp. KBS0701 TaxID=2578106 RepID=UPI00110EDF1D|nr:trypsin-like peptidase domain-containing protein [Pedobacter sp. KBS0701]QDW25922.1 trypsin-like peptidase domain-containing protein [Pedobacter sp. KBS0701]